MQTEMTQAPIPVNQVVDPQDYLYPDPPLCEQVLLDWADRQRSRQRVRSDRGSELWLMLPRGTRLTHQDRLFQDPQRIIIVSAKPEAVLSIEPLNPLQLGQAAHQLGNWHRPIQLMMDGSLQAQADAPLRDWLSRMGIPFVEREDPFEPNVALAGGHHH